MSAVYSNNGYRAMDCPLCAQEVRVDQHGGRLGFRCRGGCTDSEVAFALDPRVLAELARKNGSATKESAVAESISLPFTPVRDVTANAPPEPEWVWDGYLAPGAVTLLAGRPKVGKSTLAFGLIAAMLQEQRFGGRRARCRGVLVLTEEGADTLAEKARKFGVAEHPRFHVLLRRQVQAPWADVVAGARDYCRQLDLDVMVVDTLDKWTGLKGDDENKSGPVLQALAAASHLFRPRAPR